MSTAAVDYAPPARHDAPCRPRLVVVPSGPSVASGSRVRAERRLRPTPLGRLVVLVVVAGLATGLALAAFGGSGGARGSVTVTPGETLSQIAAHELPGRSLDDAVAAIQLANDLPNGQVQAGQVLVIPRG